MCPLKLAHSRGQFFDEEQHLADGLFGGQVAGLPAADKFIERVNTHRSPRHIQHANVYRFANKSLEKIRGDSQAYSV